MVLWWNDDWNVKNEVLKEETYSAAILSTTNPIWTVLG
jgi:hypothetical protein